MKNKAQDNDLALTLIGDNALVPATVLTRAVNETTNALGVICKNRSVPRQDRKNWVVVAASMNSPVSITIAPPAPLRQQVVADYLDVVEYFSSHVVNMPNLDDALLKILAKLGKIFDSGLRRIEYNSNGRRVTLTQDVCERAARISQSKNQESSNRFQHFEIEACLEGFLHNVETLDRLAFRLYDPVYNHVTRCSFKDDKLLSVAGSNLRNKVYVYGLVNYGGNGRPESISVYDIEPFPSESNLPDILTLPPLNIMNGIDAADYILESRYA